METTMRSNQVTIPANEMTKTSVLFSSPPKGTEDGETQEFHKETEMCSFQVEGQKWIKQRQLAEGKGERERERRKERNTTQPAFIKGVYSGRETKQEPVQGDESVHLLWGDQAPESQPFLPKKKKKIEKKNVSWDSQTYSHYRQWASPPISAGQLLARTSRWGAQREHKGAGWHRLRAVKMQRSGATPERVGRRGKSVGKKR